jgi:hypothetical protein
MFALKSFAQVPVEIHNSTGAIGALNPFPVTFSGSIDVESPLAIIDNGGSITVDNAGTFAVQAAQSGVWSVGISGAVTVSATNLDIRDLTATSDSIRIYANTAKDGSGTNYVPIVDADGNLQIDVLSLPAITASNLDIRDLTSVSDSVSAVQSGTWNIGSVTTLPNITIGSMPAVTATDLDIRDLTSVSDSVKVEGGNTADVKVTLDSEIVAVTGAFFQETQPVSIATMPSTPVTGTFWQETQPISGSVTVSGTVGTSTTLVRKESSQDLSAGALNYTTDFAAKTKVLQVLLHASTTISETVNISFNSTTGANYDTVIKSETLSSAANIAWIPDNFVLLSGDEVTVTCTNGGGTGTVYVTIVGETLN